ncbi:MAG: hypothetical protein NC236_00845 [Mycoplasma sp.]|nr:hypothetical protein [Mycoplasma sp.]
MLNKRITLKHKKTILRKFILMLNNNLDKLYLSTNSFSNLSSRKIYKVLKIIFYLNDKKYSKKDLKLMSKIFANITLDLSKKRNVNFLFKSLFKRNILSELLEIMSNSFSLKSLVNSLIKTDFEHKFDVVPTFFSQYIKKTIIFNI